MEFLKQRVKMWTKLFYNLTSSLTNYMNRRLTHARYPFIQSLNRLVYILMSSCVF